MLKKLLNKILKKFKQYKFIPTVLWFLFIVAVVFVTAYRFQFNPQTPYFTGEDSFFHVGLAQYMIDHGLIVHQFPYLNFTILSAHFTDWYFLFSVILIPFIKVFGEVVGPKILVLVLLGCVFGVVYLIFKSQKLKLAPLYALILFFLMPAHFYLRMSFIRAPVLSLLLMLLVIYFFLKNKPMALAITMFLYVWAYYMASPLIFVILFSYFIVSILMGEKINYRLIIYPLIGFVIGFIFNPFFPQNINFFVVQIIDLGAKNPLLGSELQPYDTWFWFSNSIMVLGLFFGGILISFMKNLKQNSKVIVVLIFTLFVLALQWKSRRFVEYWAVLGGMTGILLCGRYFEEILIPIKKSLFKPEKIVIIIITIIFLEVGFLSMIFSFSNTQKDIGTDSRIDSLKEVSVYLKDNSSAGDIVFNDNWDVFPYLFYFNQKDYYIVGLDLNCMKFYNQNLYTEYINLTSKNDPNIDISAIKTDFKSKWMVISADKSDLIYRIEARPDLFSKKLTRGQFIIYQVL